AAMSGATLTLTQEGKQVVVEADKLAPGQYKFLTRFDVIQAAMQNKKPGGVPFLDALKKDHDVKFFGFSRGISANADDGKPLNPEKLVASNIRGGETRVGDALRAALKETRGQPLAGVVIVTDGRQNS